MKHHHYLLLAAVLALPTFVGAQVKPKPPKEPIGAPRIKLSELPVPLDLHIKGPVADALHLLQEPHIKGQIADAMHLLGEPHIKSQIDDALHMLQEPKIRAPITEYHKLLDAELLRTYVQGVDGMTYI